EARYERREIGESIGPRLEHNDGNRERDNVLVLRFLEESNDPLARDEREPFEKVIDCVARFEVIEQSLHRDSCAIEHCGAAHHLGATADNWLFHAEKITPVSALGTGGVS